MSPQSMLTMFSAFPNPLSTKDSSSSFVSILMLNQTFFYHIDSNEIKIATSLLNTSFLFIAVTFAGATEISKLASDVKLSSKTRFLFRLRVLMRLGFLKQRNHRNLDLSNYIEARLMFQFTVSRVQLSASVSSILLLALHIELTRLSMTGMEDSVEIESSSGL
jgi:hypothetical protein